MQVRKHGCHAVQRRIDKHSFELDLERAIKGVSALSDFSMPFMARLAGKESMARVLWRNSLEGFPMKGLAGHFCQIHSQRILNNWCSQHLVAPAHFLSNATHRIFEAARSSC